MVLSGGDQSFLVTEGQELNECQSNTQFIHIAKKRFHPLLCLADERSNTVSSHVLRSVESGCDVSKVRVFCNNQFNFLTLATNVLRLRPPPHVT